MFKGFKNFDARIVYNRYAVRVTVLAIASALTAYNVAFLFQQWINPTIAGVLSLTAIKSTFHDTVKESVKQVVGTTVGSIVGIAFISWFGFNSLTLAAIIAIAFIIGWLLRLKAEGGLTIAAMVLLVNGPLLNDFQSVEQRIAGVILGSLCALAASMFIIPSNPHKVILKSSVESSRETYRLMKVISKKFTNVETIKLKEARLWNATIESILSNITMDREQIRIILADAKWSPLLSKKDVEDVLFQVRIVKRNAEAVKGITESIIHHLTNGIVMQKKVSQDIGRLIYETAEAVKKQNKLAMSDPAEYLPDEEVNLVNERKAKVANEMKKIDDTETLLLSGTLIHEITKIRNSITE